MSVHNIEGCKAVIAFQDSDIDEAENQLLNGNQNYENEEYRR